MALRSRYIQVLRSEDCFGGIAFLAMADRHGPELLTFDQNTLALEFEELIGTEPAPGVTDRLHAASVAVGTDLFWRDLPSFILLANTLGGAPFTPGVWDPADPLECAWALTEVSLLDPPDPEDLSEEIRVYLGLTCREWGLSQAPPSLAMARMPEDGHDARAQRNLDAADRRLVEAAARLRQMRIDEIEQRVAQALTDWLRQFQDLELETATARELRRRLADDLKTYTQR